MFLSKKHNKEKMQKKKAKESKFFVIGFDSKKYMLVNPIFV